MEYETEFRQTEESPADVPDTENSEITEPVSEAETASAAHEEEKKSVTVVGINFRTAGKIYYFDPAGISLRVGDRVIVETARGVEIGTVKLTDKEVPLADINPPLKAVRRKATDSDLKRDARNRELEMEAAIICKKKIRAHGLEMSLVAAEYTFDNAKLIFYFTCESRVDFRELVKDLAATFHTRIELRQIGIRDEAKMMGGLGACGRKYCCAGFLTDFVQVSIKMAKEQNFSLNSAKVSGACGRLMCCLRYEHEAYEEAIKVTPPCGSVVSTKEGEGVVVETRPLTAEIKVKLDGNEKDAPKVYKIADVRVIRLPQKRGDKGERPEKEEGATGDDRSAKPKMRENKPPRGNANGRPFDRKRQRPANRQANGDSAAPGEKTTDAQEASVTSADAGEDA